jgi:uncharacterized membrane protein
MVGAGGLVVSIIAFAVGAILDWAVTVNPYQHGFNVNKVGWILMVVGVVGAVISIVVMFAANTRRRRTVIDDGRGPVVSRIDTDY